MRNDSIHSKPVWKKNIVLAIVKHSRVVFTYSNAIMKALPKNTEVSDAVLKSLE